MRIAVTGSIATDHLMSFNGKFAEQLVADQLESISVSFLVDELEIRRGGVAANISFALGRLGLSPALAGAVGKDFDDYRGWLERHGVDTKSVHVSETKHTARFQATTDTEQNQIASFYAGAMGESNQIEIKPIADRLGGLDLVLIGPSDPAAMLQYTDECRDRGYSFAADISQQLAIMGGEDIKKLVDGATYLFTNDYESSLLLQHTGWTKDDVLDRVGSWVITYGDQGVRIEGRNHEPVVVGAVPDAKPVDPTGVGDAFRAGFFWGLSWKLSMERAAQVGCALASIVIEALGPQEYDLARSEFSNRLAKAYGNEVAAEVESKLRI